MFNDVFFVNSKVGWIVGEDVDVLFTRNGGKTWKRHQFVSEFPLNVFGSLISILVGRWVNMTVS